ncbi:MAG: endonuclease domain-containing protein [Janthinobacterium lividum]
MEDSRPHRIVIGQRVSDVKRELALGMRLNMTAAEALLWKRLKGGALGMHFRRQQIIAGFIADFYCHQKALVVEVDGLIHNANYDAERDGIFEGMGVRVIRFTNTQVQQQIGVVLFQIRTALGPTPPLRVDPPETGR